MTRKNYRTSALLLLIFLAFMAGFSGCTDGPVGIFASIALEKDINANRTAAFDGTSPDFVGLLGTNYYTLINGTIWSRTVAGGSWKKLATLPPGISNGTASSAVMERVTPTLYVTFGLIGVSTQKVWVTIDGTNWLSVDATFTGNGRIDSLLSANDQLFAVTRTDTTVESVTTTLYSVLNWNGTSFVTAGAAVTGISGRPTSIAYNGSDYWLTAGTTVFTGSPTNLTALAGIPTDTFAGVVHESAGKMILSSKTGKLHKFDAGWTVSGIFKKSSNPHAFSSPAIVDDGSNTYLLVGTAPATGAASASGYLEFDIPIAGFDPVTASANDGSDFADIVNFQTSVSTNYISALSVIEESAGKPRVFALTVGNGLWSNFFSGSTWSGWARE